MISSSDTMQYNPEKIMKAPIHQVKFVGSLKTTAPRKPDTMKLEAVEMTVGTSVLESVECNPFTKYRHTMAFEVSMRAIKIPFCRSEVS
jgi:hypothetical protein